MSFQTPVTIAKVIAGIARNEYVLPAIQREFVWNAEQIEKLFDSLVRGYPISSFLFWKIDPAKMHEFQFYAFMNYYHERDHRRNEPLPAHVGQAQTLAVLDGQQRLTALNIGLRGSYAVKLPYYRRTTDEAFPPRRLYLNLKGLAEDVEFAYEFRMLREQDVKTPNGEKIWFLVGDILGFKDQTKVFDYCVDHELTQGRDKFASHTLVRLWNAVHKDPLINYYLEEEHDLEGVLNIFIRVNSGGTKLSYSDMLLSIATAQWKTRDARKEINDLVQELGRVGEGFTIDKDFVLKACLVLTDIQNIEFRVNNFNSDNMLLIEKKWEDISRALRLTVNLVASWGYNWQTLPSYYAIIPLAYYLYQKGAPASFVEANQYKADRDAMQMYLRRALLKQVYGGQPDATLRPIRRAMQGHTDAFPANEIYEELQGTPRSLDFGQADLEGLSAYHYGQSYTFTVLAMLYPWLRYDHKFHVDHIFPRSLFTPKEMAKRGIPQERWPEWMEHVNDLANLQLLQEIPNIEKSDKEFESWLAATHPQPQDMKAYLDEHLIPDVDLDSAHFPDLLAARERLVETRLAEALGVAMPPRQERVGGL